MPWPDTPLTTYVFASTPAIKSGDLNSIQGVITNLWGGLLGTSYHILVEDFNQRSFVGTQGGYIGSLLLATMTNGAIVTEDLGGATPDGSFGVLLLKNTGGLAPSNLLN